MVREGEGGSGRERWRKGSKGGREEGGSGVTDRGGGRGGEGEGEGGERGYERGVEGEVREVGESTHLKSTMKDDCHLLFGCHLVIFEHGCPFSYMGGCFHS